MVFVWSVLWSFEYVMDTSKLTPLVVANIVNKRLLGLHYLSSLSCTDGCLAGKEKKLMNKQLDRFVSG